MYIFSLVLALCASNICISAQVRFESATAKESREIQERFLFFYGQELFQAELFQNLEAAQKAAHNEYQQDLIEKPHTKMYYYHLVSDSHCGYLIFSIDDRLAYLEMIYLNEQYRGQGLAKMALDTLEHELKDDGIEVIRLYVFAHNQRAFHLYQELGYVIENSYFDEKKPIGHLMKKMLTKTNQIECQK